MISKKDVCTEYEMNAAGCTTAYASKFKHTAVPSPPNEINSISNASAIVLNCLGLFCASLAAISQVANAVITKKLTYISHSQIFFLSCSGVVAGCLPIATYYEKQILGERKIRFLLCIRGLFGCTSYYMFFVAYKYLPLAEAAVIISTTPVVTTIIARLYLKEMCVFLHMISLLLSILAVVLAVRLPELLLNRDGVQIDSFYFIGLAAAGSGVVLNAVTTVIIRKLKHVHYAVSNLYYGIFGMVETTIIISLVFPFVYPQCGRDQILCIALGISGLMGVFSITWAIQLQPVGIVAFEKFSLEIIVTIVFQIIFFSEYPDVYVSCSAFIVLVSLAIIGIHFWLLALPEDSMARKKLKFCFF